MLILIHKQLAKNGNTGYELCKIFLKSINTNSTENPINKLDLLIKFISPTLYEYIADLTSYDEAISKLNELYIKLTKLTTRKQNPRESVDEFLQSLRNLAKDCYFKVALAEVYDEEPIGDKFISGHSSNLIR